MREIKFRAWNERDREMIYVPGFYWFEEERVDDGSGKGLYSHYVLMQFTGLKDKNGKEIYEGDILHQDSYSDWVVEWEGAGFKIYNTCNPGVYFQLVPSEREVIGNIYENPEMVKSDG